MTAPPAELRGLRRVWWYVKELNGEHAYDRYAERARAAGEPVVSRAEFERARVDRRDLDPREGGHCC
ncbi:YbdD/YjiX family protein [Streptomyces sp. ODS28]|uniref:YbdD/YjiX family protein n=1 Tax=Streptomyces sp. ODS28 TaxID=3136688 RepID=UPI0031EBA8D5